MKPEMSRRPIPIGDQDEVYYISRRLTEVYCMDPTVRAGETIFLPETKRTRSYYSSPNSSGSSPPCCNRGPTGTVWTGTGSDVESVHQHGTSLRAQPHTRPIQPPPSKVKYGVKMLTPEETAELLPSLPAFWVPRERPGVIDQERDRYIGKICQGKIRHATGSSNLKFSMYSAIRSGYKNFLQHNRILRHWLLKQKSADTQPLVVARH